MLAVLHSDGLGYASAELLSSEGAKVIICGRRGDYLTEKAKTISEKTNNEVLAIQADVSKADDCKKLVEKTISKFKKIDILLNNAGASAAALFEDVTDKNWEITNLCGPHSDFVTGQTIHVNGGSYYP